MKKLKVTGRKRICKYPSCKNVLSMYNHEKFCYLHQDKLMFQTRIKSGF